VERGVMSGKRKYTEQQFKDAAKDSKSIAETLQKLSVSGYTRFKERVAEWNVDTSHFVGQSWSKGKILKSKPTRHLDLIIDYFKTIDTIEKAYWLGFLYADGYITKDNNGLQIALAIKDEEHLDKFIKIIGANKDCKRYYGPYKTAGKSVQIKITDKAFCSYLINHGCVNKKSLIIRLPKLGGEELYKAFLSGYYDGDGTQNEPSITCGSKLFLDDLKSHFNIKSEIKDNGNICYLYFGREFFRDIIGIYPKHLKRKSDFVQYKTYEHTCEVCSIIFMGTKDQKNCSNECVKSINKKFEISKEDLEKLVWEIPTEKIGKQFGVSGKAIEKRCKSFGITKPGRGYWAKKKSNQQS
jgi:hypothetical protein